MRHRIHTREPLTGSVTIGGEEFHHAAHVVRLREGEEVELFDGDGHAANGLVVSIAPASLVVRIEKAIDTRESPYAIDLAMAIIQLEKFELVLQKATELGVRSIIPIVTDRVEIRAERYRGKGERWEKIIVEAVKQSGRAKTPKLEAAIPFDEAIRREGFKILFDAGGSNAPLDAGDRATIFIGPEGGWSERELQLARENGCVFARLGPRRLRAETAAIVACAVIASRHGDLQW